MFVSLYVPYRNKNFRTNLGEIWHRHIFKGFLRFLAQGAQNGFWGASADSTVQFGKTFMNQKLQGTPVLVGTYLVFGPVI